MKGWKKVKTKKFIKTIESLKKSGFDSIQIGSPYYKEIIEKLNQLDKIESSKNKVKLVDVKDRLPEEYVSVFLICIYPNGNSVQGVGSYHDYKWDIEWSDDHPDSEDVKYWVEIK